jgi:hypothetical protein
MRQGRLLSSSLLLAVVLSPCVQTCFAKSRTHRIVASKSSKASTKIAAKRPAGQRSIDDTRATEIQTALVRSGYMTEPTGHWDAATETAMQKYQSDNGWQTKLMPDSRAIIKLGLGPSQTSSVSAGEQPLHESSEMNLSQR